jgi:flagellar hook-basal body complex protein FliE
LFDFGASGVDGFSSAPSGDLYINRRFKRASKQRKQFTMKLSPIHFILLLATISLVSAGNHGSKKKGEEKVVKNNNNLAPKQAKVSFLGGISNSIQSSFKSFGQTLNGAVNWVTNKATNGRVQDIEFIGDCDVKTLRGLVHGSEKDKTDAELKVTPPRLSMRKLLVSVPPIVGPITLDNLYQPALYYTFLAYQAYTLFENPGKVNMMRNVKNYGRTFYTGNFDLLKTRKMLGVKTLFHKQGDRDAFWLEFKNDEQKIIVLSFRGSTTTDDFVSDVASKVGVKPDSRFYDKKVCAYEKDENSNFFVGEGFVNGLPKNVLEQVAADLKAARQNNPDYKIVLVGHSLGGAKAMLATMYLKLHHPTIVPDALYTYGQPVTGSTNYNDYFAKCYGAEKYVRITSSDDIIPWFGTSWNRQHSSLVKEIFAPDWNEPKFIECLGPKDKKCSAGTTCKTKNWDHHSIYAGMTAKKDLFKIRDIRRVKRTLVAAKALN